MKALRGRQGTLAYDRYSVAGHEEWMMRIGLAVAPPILFVPPLFEEMNRTRALIAGIMRVLAARGFGCWLPDLPGTGESVRPLATVTWDDWRHGVSEAADHISAVSGHPPLVASMRGGCLIDDAAAEGVCHWRFAPVTGAGIVRDMERAGLAGGVAWAGYAPSPALAASLAEAKVAPASTIRTLRLVSDPQEADAKVDAPALWRRSEPGTSAELTEALANDLADWAMLCGA